MTNISPIKPSSKVSMNELQLCMWLGDAAPGDSLEYHQGFLVKDIEAGSKQRLKEPERVMLERLAKLPVVRCSGVLPISNKHGTNYQPTFEIVGWTDRPAGLSGTEVAKGIPPAPSAPAPAAHMPPPAQAPAGVGAPVF